MSLMDLYAGLLSFAGAEPDSNGAIDIIHCGKRIPAKVGDKRLKLPTKENLRNFNQETDRIFHPLQEHINRGESEVVRSLRKMLGVRLNSAALIMFDELINLLATTALHPKMDAEQRELLKAVPDEVSVMTRANFMEFVTKAIREHPDGYFINIYLKKFGTFKGEKHSRVGVVTFPFYRLMEEKPGKFNKSEWAGVQKLFEYIFPGSKDVEESYNGFSDNANAPWLDVLLKTSYNVASRLNELAALYGDLIDKDKLITFNDEWIDVLDNLDPYRKEIMLIPSQLGNDGSVGAEPGKEAPAEVKVASTMPAPQPSRVDPAPIRQPNEVIPAGLKASDVYGSHIQRTPVIAQTVKPVAGKVSYSDVLNQRHQQQPAPGQGMGGNNAAVAAALQILQQAGVNINQNQTIDPRARVGVPLGGPVHHGNYQPPVYYDQRVASSYTHGNHGNYRGGLGGVQEI